MTHDDEVVRFAAVRAQRAAFDEATGLANLRLLLRELGRALARSRRTRQPILLAALEADAESDPQTVADRLTAATREEDLVARIGHHRFAIVLADLSTREGAALLESLRTLLSDVTRLAIGVRPISTDDAEVETPLRLFGDALEAMGQAAATGSDLTVKWQGPGVQVN